MTKNLKKLTMTFVTKILHKKFIFGIDKQKFIFYYSVNNG